MDVVVDPTAHGPLDPSSVIVGSLANDIHLLPHR